jgi:hypothetical protein
MNRLNQTSGHVCAPCVPSPAAAESVVSGECNCGAVKYSMRGKPLNVLICHCQDCREAHGSPMSTVFVAKADQITLDGPIGEYDRRGQNKRVRVDPTCLHHSPLAADRLSLRGGADLLHDLRHSDGLQPVQGRSDGILRAVHPLRRRRPAEIAHLLQREGARGATHR